MYLSSFTFNDKDEIQDSCILLQHLMQSHWMAMPNNKY